MPFASETFEEEFGDDAANVGYLLPDCAANTGVRIELDSRKAKTSCLYWRVLSAQSVLMIWVGVDGVMDNMEGHPTNYRAALAIGVLLAAYFRRLKP